MKVIDQIFGLIWKEHRYLSSIQLEPIFFCSLLPHLLLFRHPASLSESSKVSFSRADLSLKYL